MLRTLHRLLLRCYPQRFRDRFDPEIREALEGGWRAARGRGALAALWFVAARVWDAAVNGWRERRSDRRRPIRRPKDSAMTSFLRDLTFGLRLLRFHPRLAILAISTLALGIGLAVSLFSVAYGALLRPLPYRDSARVVMLWERPLQGDMRKGSGTPANFLDWRARSRSFSQMGGLAPFSATVSGAGEAGRVDGRRVTADAFFALAVDPLLGRLFTADDERPGNGVAILSYRLWQQQFGGDPAIVGRAVMLNEIPRRVVGVLAPDFRLPDGHDAMFIPWVFSAFERTARRSHFVTVVARLKDSVTFEQARADVATVAEGLAREFPDANKGDTILLEPIRDAIVGDAKPALLLLVGAVTLVLLIACVNVAGLLVARATSRRQEMSVRMALGANRARLVRQLLAESVLLSSIAALAGLLLAYLAVETLRPILPAALGTSLDLRIDPRVALAALGLCTLTAIAFGLAPALWMFRREDAVAIREGRPTPSRSAVLVRRVLVTCQVALSVVLLVGAGLLARSLARLLSVELGFRPDHLLTMKIELPPRRYQTPAQWQTLFDRLLPELRGIPGVTDVAGSGGLPLSVDGSSNAVFIEGRPKPGPNENRYAIYRLVTPGYFHAIGIPVIEGRDFSSNDRIGGARVGAVNQTFARQVWPDGSPIGKRLTFAPSPKPEDWITVVAVVKDTHHFSLAEPVDIQLYAPYTQDPNWFPPTQLVLRTSGSPTSVAASARQRIRGIDAAIPVYEVQPMDAVIGSSIAVPRFHLWLFAALSLSALALSAIGIYGLLAFSVALRVREIGVRTALGATRRDIAGMIVGEGMRLTGVGLVVGLLVALATTGWLRALLFQIEPYDPATLAGITALLAAIAAVACYIPARRAARIDPLVALRPE
jgi:putative ABC transport system permease protein